jgi:PPOX class probable F420-dependent enzyme
LSIRLSRDEAWAVLADAHTGILTTLKADGTPISLPVWFVALDERIYVATPEHTKKVARVKHDPRVSFLVESGERWAELLGVHLTGEARVVTDDDLRARIRTALDDKYRAFRTEPAAMPDATRRHYSVVMTVLEITPDDRILSWDNSRLQLST